MNATVVCNNTANTASEQDMAEQLKQKLVEIQAACEDARKRVGEMEQESEKLEEEGQSLAQGDQAKVTRFVRYSL